MAARTAGSLTSRALTCSSTIRWRRAAKGSPAGGMGMAGWVAIPATSQSRARRRILAPIADLAGHRRQADGDDGPLLQALGRLGDHQEVLDEAPLGDHHLTAHPELV